MSTSRVLRRALWACWCVSVCTAVPEAAADGPKAADAVTLRDRKAVVLGVVAEQSPRGLKLEVRRDWARAHVPDWLKRWEQTEKVTVSRAQSQRRERLNAWKRDRSAAPAAGDVVVAWIDRELGRLKPGAPTDDSPLISVRLAAGEASKVVKGPKGSEGVLRQAWRLKFDDPETMSVADLKEAIAGRGIDVDRGGPVSVDDLLPLSAESDAVWLVRRAATEVAQEPALRYIRHQGLLLPDIAQGEAPVGIPALQALPALSALLTGEAPSDPLPGELRKVAGRGRVGTLVTALDVATDFSQVQVTSTLWVRQGVDRWGPAGSNVVKVRPEDLGPNAGKGLADDPQVAGAFKVVEGLTLTEIPREFKTRALGIGAATATALGQSRGQTEAELARLGLPVNAAPVGP